MKEPTKDDRIAADEPTAAQVAAANTVSPMTTKIMLMHDVLDAAIQWRRGGRRGPATRQEELGHEKALREAVDAWLAAAPRRDVESP